MPSDTEFDMMAKLPPQSTNFVLSSLVVTVDSADCVGPLTPITGGAFAEFVRRQIDDKLAGMLGAGGSVVTPGVNRAGELQNNVVSITIPMTSGGATVDISIELSVGLVGQQVAAFVDSVDVTESGGLDVQVCAGAIQETATAFMNYIANNQIAPDIANGLNNGPIRDAADAAHQKDIQPRNFRAHIVYSHCRCDHIYSLPDDWRAVVGGLGSAHVGLSWVIRSAVRG